MRNSRIEMHEAMEAANIRQGAAINRLRKLQRAWDHWFPLRQSDPLRGKNAEQSMAEHECARLAPIIQQAKLEAYGSL